MPPDAVPLSLVDLRRLAQVSLRADPASTGLTSFGAEALDAALGGGVARAALHDVHAATPADLTAALGFAAGFVRRAAKGKPVLWVVQDHLETEGGRLHAAGLAELGLDPGDALLVRARDAEGVLRAAGEGARCTGLGAVLLASWGASKRLDLTASRRLALAAQAAGVTVLNLRVATRPETSAAWTRWEVAALPSRALEANAPGDPAFRIRLLRHRGGLGEREWRVEWNRDRQSFEDRALRDHQEILPQDKARPDAAPLSRSVVAFPAERPDAAGGTGAGYRKTG